MMNMTKKLKEAAMKPQLIKYDRTGMAVVKMAARQSLVGPGWKVGRAYLAMDDRMYQKIKDMPDVFAEAISGSIVLGATNSHIPLTGLESVAALIAFVDDENAERWLRGRGEKK